MDIITASSRGIVDIVSRAFAPDRRLNTRDARCFVCRTVCNIGRAAIVQHGVLCAGCAIDRSPRVSDEDARPPQGWTWGAGYVVGAEPLDVARNDSPARTVAPSTVTYSEPLPVADPFAGVPEIVALRKEIDRALVKAGKPAKFGTVDTAASKAGRALAGFRKPSDKRREPLAAK